MRRITIFADEDEAQKATAWLEANGLDYMSEAYAEPSIQRRNPPERRTTPERLEEGPGMLAPLKKPESKQVEAPGNFGPLAQMLLQMLREAGTLQLDDMKVMARDRGWKPSQVRDTLRRLVKAKHVKETVFGDGKQYTLE